MDFAYGFLSLNNIPRMLEGRLVWHTDFSPNSTNWSYIGHLPCWRAQHTHSHFSPRVAWPIRDNIHISTYRLRLRGNWTNLSNVQQLTSRGVRISSRSAGFQTPPPEFLKDQFELRFLSRSCIRNKQIGTVKMLELKGRSPGSQRWVIKTQKPGS